MARHFTVMTEMDDDTNLRLLQIAQLHCKLALEHSTPISHSAIPPRSHTERNYEVTSGAESLAKSLLE